MRTARVICLVLMLAVAYATERGQMKPPTVLKGLEHPEKDQYHTRVSPDWINLVVAGSVFDEDRVSDDAPTQQHPGAVFSEDELLQLGDDCEAARVLMDTANLSAVDGPHEEHRALAETMDEAQLTQAILHDEEEHEGVDAAVDWPEPPQFTEDDVRRIVGAKSGRPLRKVERMVLSLTNTALAEGGKLTDLETNLHDAMRNPAEMLAEDDVKRLDTKALLSPLEKQVMEHVNHNRLRGEGEMIALRMYKKLLRTEYWRHAAHPEANSVYDALRSSFGTDEDMLVSVLCGKTQDEIRLLAAAYEQLIAVRDGEGREIETFQTCEGARGERKCKQAFRSHLEREIYHDVSGGWTNKLRACLNSEVLGEDHQYFTVSYVAESWRQLLVAVDKEADKAVESEDMLEQALGWSTKAVFGTMQEVNGAVKEAQSYYIDMAKKSDENGDHVTSVLAKTGFVLSTIAGSFGTKALDPTLTTEEVEEGVVDAAILVASFGATAFVTAAAKTVVGVRVLSKMSAAMTSLSQLSYGLMHALRFTGKHYAKYNALAQKVGVLAEKVGVETVRGKALKAYEKALGAAAKQAARADTAVSVARDTARKARLLSREVGASADDVANAVEEATQAAVMAKREVLALRESQAAVRSARKQATMLTEARRRAHEGVTAVRARIKPTKSHTTPTSHATRDSAVTSTATADDAALAAVDDASLATVDDASTTVADDLTNAGAPKKPNQGASVADDAKRTDDGASAADDAARTDDAVEMTIDDLPTKADDYGHPRPITATERQRAMGELSKYLDDVEKQTGFRPPEDAFEPIIRPINPYKDAAELGMNEKRLKESLIAFDDWQEIITFQVKKDVRMYRVGGLHDGARGSGKWFTLKPTRSEAELREGLAVIDDFLKRPEANWEVVMEKGSTVFFGKTAPQHGGLGAKVHVGGEMQFFAPPKVSNFEPVKAHFFGNINPKHLASEAAADAAAMASRTEDAVRAAERLSTSHVAAPVLASTAVSDSDMHM